MAIINNPPPNEVTITPFVMIAPPLRHQSPEGDGAHGDITRTGNTAPSQTGGARAVGVEPPRANFSCD